jgi:predicted nucleotidyltransferase
MNRPDLLNILSSFFKLQSDAYDLELVFLYGSWAGGQPQAESDVDLAVVFNDQDMPEERAFARVVNLESALTNRLKQEVNILWIHLDFRKPLLYYNAIVQGEPIYIKNFESYIEIKNEALYQMEDYSIFGLPWQIEMAERNLQELRHA